MAQKLKTVLISSNFTRSTLTLSHEQKLTFWRSDSTSHSNGREHIFAFPSVFLIINKTLQSLKDWETNKNVS